MPTGNRIAKLAHNKNGISFTERAPISIDLVAVILLGKICSTILDMMAYKVFFQFHGGKFSLSMWNYEILESGLSPVK